MPRFSLRALIVCLVLAFSGTLAFAEEAPLPKDSLYQLETRWLDQEGNRARLQQFRGHPVLITMAYTRCKYSCPMIVEKLKKIEKELAFLPELKILLVSFDHKNETPNTFRAFLKEKGLDSQRWKMLAGENASAVRELAAVLEVNFKAEKNGDFSHSNVIALLDSDGRKRASLNGLAADIKSLVSAAQEKK